MAQELGAAATARLQHYIERLGTHLRRRRRTVMEEIPTGGHGPQWKEIELMRLSWIDRSLWV